MTVSILIPVRNAHETIYELLISLYNSNTRADEIIVVDQGDNDLTKNEIDKFISSYKIEIKYKKSSRIGLCANRNDCINEATGDFLIFIDQDMTVDKNWLSNMILEWDQNWNYGLVVISGRTLPGEEFEPGDLVPSIQEGTERTIYRGRPKTTEVLYGAYFGAPKKLFLSMNPYPFDERLGVGTKFPGADDTDFSYRVLKEGHPIVFEPKLLAYHHPPPRSWRKMRYDYSIGYGAYLCKHLFNGDLQMINDFIRFNIISLVKMLKSVFKFEEPEGSARFLGIVGVIKGFFVWSITSNKKR